MSAVREATEADRPEIEALIGEMIPGCDVAARWRWLYEGNPGGRALTWLAIADSGEVAGCTSFFPFRISLDGVPIRGALGGDGYIRPEFRRRGLGGLMHEASRKAMPSHAIACMYGAPGNMNLTPLKHGGSREVGMVTRWVRPLRAQALGSFVELSARLACPRTRVRLDSMAPFDDRVDRIWEAARPTLRLAAVRDAAFYTWRFIEAPAQCQLAFVVLDRHGEPIGVCVLELIDDDRVLRIVDLVTLPGRWHACLGAIARHAIENTNAELVDTKLFSLDGRRRRMWRSGFVERDSKPFLCMIAPGGDRRLVDPDRWFYSGADSDVDFHT